MTCAGCTAPLEEGARFCPHCGHSVAPTEPAPGQSLSGIDIAGMMGRTVGERYRVLAELGEGGMGAVFRAEQLSVKRTIALKVLRPELSADAALVQRFNAEAKMAARLSHANIVTLFDFGQDRDGSLFIAMEYVEGPSLRQVMMSEGPLAPTRALAICEQVGAALAYAHSQGIVHRDLKPDNIMLTQQGRQRDVAKVLDFGIAKLRDERPDGTAMPMTRAGDLLGTPQYMAPEQIRAEPIDGRTDVYAMGALLYEMITGRLPFEGPTVMAILSKHLTEAPVPPTRRRPDLNLAAPLDRLVLGCMGKRPEDRPRSMDDLVAEIGQLRVGLGGTPPPDAMARAASELGLASTTPAHPALDPAHLPAAPATPAGPAALAAAPSVAHGHLTPAANAMPAAGLPSPAPAATPAHSAASHAPATPAAGSGHAAVPPASTATRAPTPLAVPSFVRWTLVGIALAAFGAAGLYGYWRFSGTTEPEDELIQRDDESDVVVDDDGPPRDDRSEIPAEPERDESGAVRLDFSTRRSREANR